jgi:uncharacterized membrane protein (DUF2068 family)
MRRGTGSRWVSQGNPGFVIGFRFVACFEAPEGLVVPAGLGASSLLHRDAQDLAESLVHEGWLAHGHRIAGIILRVASHVNDATLWLIAAAALVYSLARFIEAYGLFRQREWAEWFALFSTLIYLPWELLALVHRPTADRYGLVIVNAGLACYPGWRRYRSLE